MTAVNCKLSEGTPAAASNETRAAEIEAWLVSRISGLAEIEAEETDVSRPFTYYGLGSAELVMLTGELEDYLGRTISPTLPWDYPTIKSAARHLAEQPGLEREGAGAGGRTDAFDLDSFLTESRSTEELLKSLSDPNG